MFRFLRHEPSACYRPRTENSKETRLKRRDDQHTHGDTHTHTHTTTNIQVLKATSLCLFMCTLKEASLHTGIDPRQTLSYHHRFVELSKTNSTPLLANEDQENALSSMYLYVIFLGCAIFNYFAGPIQLTLAVYALDKLRCTWSCSCRT